MIPFLHFLHKIGSPFLNSFILSCGGMFNVSFIKSNPFLRVLSIHLFSTRHNRTQRTLVFLGTAKFAATCAMYPQIRPAKDAPKMSDPFRVSPLQPSPFLGGLKCLNTLFRVLEM